MNDGTSPRGATSEDGLWSPGRRALTLGLVLNVTIVASEALAVGTILPIVAKDLGGIDLYGWVFAGFFLGNLLGIVVAGMLIDRGGLVRPFVLGIGLFSIGLLVGGLAPTMEVLVAARVIQGFGAGAIPAVAYVSIARAMPQRLRPRMFATQTSNALKGQPKVGLPFRSAGCVDCLSARALPSMAQPFWLIGIIRLGR